MRFTSVSISNFRAIREFEVSGLTDFILVAGPNGCGKSCIFDAIRLLKSAYGGYSVNEVMQWLGEFQVNLQDRDSLRTLFRDPSNIIEISAHLVLASDEKAYLRASAEELVEPVAWRGLLGAQFDEYRNQQTALATLYRQHREAVDTEITVRAAQLRRELEAESHALSLIVETSGRLKPGDSLVAEVLFQTFNPIRLGIIDYHSASRNYVREALGGVNVGLHDSTENRRDTSLYNLQNKYSNIKTELATGYIRDLIARDAGVEGKNEKDLNATLRDLFTTFFPDKTYEGVRPDQTGGLKFSVTTSDGARHDINDLSSGEKEVLYGYLRLRSNTPRNSIILIDEPELHLNPALLRGFPDFYHRNIGRAMGNQLWLVTHSDALLRQAVGNVNYSVFHMAPATALNDDRENQASEVLADDQLDSAIVSLVGDLATYRPNAKLVIFEGGGDSDFDVNVVTRLFPQFALRVNCVSGGKKARVRDLYEVLAETAGNVGLANKFYAVVDRDSDTRGTGSKGAQSLAWDVYHIENYFLAPHYLRSAVATLRSEQVFANDAEVLTALQRCARQTVGTLVMEQLRKEVNAQIMHAVNLGGRPGDKDPVTALEPALHGSWKRLDEIRGELTTEQLQERAGVHRRTLEEAVADGSWVSLLPARPILKEFVRVYLHGKAEYSAFMGVVLDKMADAGYQPAGMTTVLNQVLPPRSV